jgi:hypothetical protein
MLLIAGLHDQIAVGSCRNFSAGKFFPLSFASLFLPTRFPSSFFYYTNNTGMIIVLIRKNEGGERGIKEKTISMYSKMTNACMQMQAHIILILCSAVAEKTHFFFDKFKTNFALLLLYFNC